MRVSEGLRIYHQKLFPDITINEKVVKEVEAQTWAIFYQDAGTATSRLGDLMVRVPADVLRKRNGTDSVTGNPIEAAEMLIRAIGGTQALEQVAQQHTAELDLFTDEYMEALVNQTGLANLNIIKKG